MPDYLIAVCANQPEIDVLGLRDSDWTDEQISDLQIIEVEGTYAVLWSTTESLGADASEVIQTAAGAVLVDGGLLPASWPIETDKNTLSSCVTGAGDSLQELLNYAANTGDLVFRQPITKSNGVAASDSDTLRAALDDFLGDGDGPARFVTSYVEDEARRAFAVLIDMSKAELAMEELTKWIADREPEAAIPQSFGPLPPYLFAAPHLERFFVKSPNTDKYISA